MSKIMIVVGSVRPGRIGLPIATWVYEHTVARGEFEVDFVDLAEVDLPFMDEPNHPRAQKYTQQHSLDWSARVAAADGFVFVTPEYNHSFSPALKNALDYLSYEWWRKPVGIVSYGGVSGGTRGVVALEPVLLALGLVRIGAAVEIPFAGAMLGNGKFSPNDKVTAILDHLLTELELLSVALKPTRLLG